MAEGILRKKISERGLNVKVDSAGTARWHAGEPPDRRAIKAARKYGVDISSLIARKFTKKDFEEFDYIYVMDSSNYRDVLSVAKSDHDTGKVKLLLSMSEAHDAEVPDPWYGGEEGFDDVFHMMEKACDAIVNDLNK